MPPRPNLTLPPEIARQQAQQNALLDLRLTTIASVFSQLAAVDFSHALQTQAEMMQADKDDAELHGQGEDFPPDDYQIPQINLQAQMTAEIATVYVDTLLEHLGLIKRIPTPPTTTTASGEDKPKPVPPGSPPPHPDMH